ncbi:MAG: 7-cyano-7-deazaguanine synthase [Candidatus Omnitrophota bacterium]|nr:7-cyano-7-deazaguanine synthase [Candidatus Omnitrophota bacterium]
MNKKAIVLLSGGLDSILAVKLMLEQGIDVIAVNFSAKLCMCGTKKTGESPAQAAAKMLGVELKTIDITDDFVEIVKNPRYGHGSNINPCIDCKIYMLKHAKSLMEKLGASFLVTGEVLGERPMSQRKDALNLIEKTAGVRGILLRPLTAKNLPLTKPELEGIVDREKLLDIRGRSRKPQMALAEKFGITKYPSPAGGCLLTDPCFAQRVKEAMKHGEFIKENLAILSVGRHFRLSDSVRLVVGRDAAENEILESLAKSGDIIFIMKDHQGPLSILRGKADDKLVNLAASVAAYHTKFRGEKSVAVNYWEAGSLPKDTIFAKPADKETVESLRI